MQQAGLLEQEGDLEQVADGIGLGDDVVRQRLAAEAPMHLAGGIDDRQFLGDVFAVLQKRRAQQPRHLEFLQQPLAARGFVQFRVTRLARTQREELGDDLLVHATVLAHVQRRQVETENVRSPQQIAQPAARHALRSIRGQRIGDHGKVPGKFGVVRVGPGIGNSRPVGHAMAERMGGGGKPGVDPGQGPTVRLVAAMLGHVGRKRRQFVECRGGFHDADRLRQLAAQLMQLVEIKVHGRRGMPRQRMPHHVGRHVRIAVAVTADPAAQFQVVGGAHLADVALRQQVFDFRVEPRYLAQEGVTVVGQAVLDLIVHRQPQLAQDARLP